MGYVTHEIAISQDSHQHEVVMHQVRVPTRWEDWELGPGRWRLLEKGVIIRTRAQINR